MMGESMYDVAFAFDGDHIRLEQSNGIGEVSVIDLHAAQLRLLAERAGLIGDAGKTESERRLERHLRTLHAKISEADEILRLDNDEPRTPEEWIVGELLSLSSAFVGDLEPPAPVRECPATVPRDIPGHADSAASHAKAEPLQLALEVTP